MAAWASIKMDMRTECGAPYPSFTTTPSSSSSQQIYSAAPPNPIQGSGEFIMNTSQKSINTWLRFQSLDGCLHHQQSNCKFSTWFVGWRWMTGDSRELCSQNDLSINQIWSCKASPPHFKLLVVPCCFWDKDQSIYYHSQGSAGSGLSWPV